MRRTHWTKVPFVSRLLTPKLKLILELSVGFHSLHHQWILSSDQGWIESFWGLIHTATFLNPWGVSASGQELFFSLVVQQRILLYLLPDGSRVNRLWWRCVLLLLVCFLAPLGKRCLIFPLSVHHTEPSLYISWLLSSWSISANVQ